MEPPRQACGRRKGIPRPISHHHKRATMEGGKKIADWYEGRSILVTGGTGFIGKVLVEKLLRSCPKLEAIYLLVRPKKGHQVSDRIQSLLSLSIFDEVRKIPGQLEKVKGLEGDVTLPSLGLTIGDQSLLTENISVIFHSAASVRFDEALEDSVAINLTATKSVIQLAQTMTKLEAMVHVSTAYCNCQNLEVLEQVYPVNRDPENVIETVQTLDPDILEIVTPKLLDGRPNTYTFTKALAENIINEQSGVLPIAIIRPSIVTAALREPIPGWIDNLNGPTGLLVSAGKGVMRTLLCDRQAIVDFIPVDITTNFCISVAWHTAVSRSNNILVYNCTTSATNPLRWANVESWFHSYLIKYPSESVIWYPGGSFKKYRFTNYIARILFQVLPAHVFDLFMKLAGKNPIMVKVQEKLLRSSKMLEFFTTKEFRFCNNNMMELWNHLSPEDKNTFNFDVTSFDWKSYIETYVLGTRRFILKENAETLPKARKALFRMYLLHKATEWSFYAAIVWFILSKSAYSKQILFSLIGVLITTVKKIKSNSKL